ncbi:MAG: Histone acetyltransferase [Chlorobi bacterium]|nr:Histone acetyltransferase [Chlorobiota bacterium]
MAPETITIRRLDETHDSIPRLTALLHRAYKRLADMGLRFLATHQTDEQTLERARDGECYLAIEDGEIIGTITYYPPAMAHGTPWYDRPDVASLGQFAVEPALQGRGIGNMLLDHVESLARRDGAAEMALDTSEKAHHLIEYYGRHGYRFVEHTQWSVVNYRSVVMSRSLIE